MFRIERSGQVRERAFDAVPAECAESHAVVALAIALAIDAEARKPRAALEGLEPREPGRPSLLTAQAALAHAVLAGFSFGGKAGLELPLLEWLDLRTEVLAEVSMNETVANTSGSFTATLFAGVVAGCGGGPVTEGFRMAVCTGLAAGVVTAQGSGYSTSTGSSAFLLDAMGGLRTELRAGIPWIVDLEMYAPINGVSFRVQRIDDAAAVRPPEALGVMVSVGAGFTL